MPCSPAEDSPQPPDRRRTQRRKPIASNKLTLHEIALDALPWGAIVVDVLAVDQPIVLCNRGFERLTGYPRDEILGRNCRFLQGDDRDQQGVAVLREAVATGRAAQVVLRNYRRDGSLFMNEVTIDPVRDATGRVTHFVGMQQDVTEQLAMRSALTEADLRFEAVADHIGLGFWLAVLDPVRVVYANPAMERIWGFSAKMIREDYRIRFLQIHPDDRQRVIGYVTLRVESPQSPASELEYRIIRQDGSLHWLRDTAFPIRDATGTVIRLAGIVEDITEEKAAIDALAASEALYRLLAENSTDVVWAIRPNGVVEYVSPACRDAMGFAPASIVGRPIYELWHPDDVAAVARSFARIQEHGKPEVVSARVRRADGRNTWFESTVRAVRDVQTGEVGQIIASSRDISQRKEAERRLRQRDAELAHLTRTNTMGEMAAIFAHEINHPLATIANYAGNAADLHRAGRVLGDELSQILEKINEQAIKAGEITRRLKELVARIAPRRERLDLGRLVREVIEMVPTESLLEGASIELDWPPLLPTVHGDPVQLHQVLVNLVRNALDAMQETPRSQRQVTIRAKVIRNAVRTSVSDRGRGMTAAEMKWAFKPYHTTKPGGLGMGLPISQSIVTAHGGRLWCEPRATGGMTFYIELPAESDRKR